VANLSNSSREIGGKTASAAARVTERHIVWGIRMNRSRIQLAGACGLAAVCLAGTQARADTGLGAAAYYAYVEGNGSITIPSIIIPGSVGLDGGFVTLEATPGAAVLASTPAIGPGDTGLEAVGQLTYFAEILGPADVGDIPVRLYYALAVSGDGLASQENAALSFDGAVHLVSIYNGAAPVSESGYLVQGEPTDTQFEIGLVATSIDGGKGYIDPMLEVDPTWALANPELASQLSLTFSGGVQNGLGNLTAGVPEPATWTVMLLGLGLCGGLLRRRTERSVPA
jgi:hypothetical protein